MTRPTRSTVLKIGFGVAVVAFGVVFVASRWSEFRSALADTSPGWVVVAAVFATAGLWVASLGLRATIAATSTTLPVFDVSRVFFISQLGKYIPGSVWPIVAVTQMCQRYGVSRRAAAVAGILNVFFATVAGGLVGIVLVIVGAAQHTPALWWLLVVVPFALIALHPRVIGATIRWALRVTRREPLDVEVTGAVLRRSVGWPVVSWLLLGLQCWALVIALGGPVWGSLAPSVGGFALAYVAGTLFVPAPAGVGVREAVLGVALTGVVAHSALTHDDVLVVVLLSRVLLAFLDFGQAGVVALVGRRGAALRVET